jgi:hypothetical protein
LPSGRSYYRLKVWRQGAPQPARWDLRGLGDASGWPSGSIALNANHVDATFGNITIVPGPFKKGPRPASAIQSAKREKPPDSDALSPARIAQDQGLTP